MLSVYSQLGGLLIACLLNHLASLIRKSLSGCLTTRVWTPRVIVEITREPVKTPGPRFGLSYHSESCAETLFSSELMKRRNVAA